MSALVEVRDLDILARALGHAPALLAAVNVSDREMHIGNGGLQR